MRVLIQVRDVSALDRVGPGYAAERVDRRAVFRRQNSPAWMIHVTGYGRWE